MDPNENQNEQVTDYEKEFMAGIEDPKPAENLILGKFKTVQDLEEAYKNLETKLGKPKEQKPEEVKPEENKKPIPETETGELGKRESSNPDQSTSQSQVDLRDYLIDQLRTGRAFDDDLAKEMQDQFNLPESVSKVLYDQSTMMYRKEVEEIVNLAGGQESFEEMNQYVVDNYSDDDIAALNFAISNPATRKHTISGLLAEAKVSKTKLNPEKTTQDKVDKTTNLPDTKLEPFKTDKEMYDAMADERYVNKAHPDHTRFVKEVWDRYAISQSIIG